MYELPSVITFYCRTPSVAVYQRQENVVLEQQEYYAVKFSSSFPMCRNTRLIFAHTYAQEIILVNCSISFMSELRIIKK